MDYIGKSINRPDSFDKARGKALYTDDYSFENMLYVSLVRSPVSHAMLKKITVPQLQEGTYCFTASDIVKNLIPSIMNDQPILAYDHIRYQGEPVAIVAAPSKEQADEIAGSVCLEYEELPVVEDMELALADDSAKLFDSGNLCTEFNSDKGDINKAFSECFLTVEDSFSTPMQIHGFMEPEAAVTYIDGEGRLSIISATQNPSGDLYTAVNATGRTADKISSKAAVVGGAFGGKDGNTAQVFAAVVTHLTERPAKYIFSREENIRWGLKRHSSETRAKIGFDKYGRILAADCSMLLDTGAYALYGPAVLGLGMEHFTGCYAIDNVRLRGKLVYTNHAPASAMRGFGAPQAAMAFENLLNRAAAALGISQLEIRKKNAVRQGQAGPMGGKLEHSIGLAEALEVFEDSDFYKEMALSPEKDCGYGIAVGMMSTGLGKNVPDKCYCSAEEKNGEYFIRTDLVDLGQGSQTVLSQIAAQALGVPVGKVHLLLGEADFNACSGSTAASRSTFIGGHSITKAIEQIKSGKKYAEVYATFPEATGEAIHAYFSFIVQGAKVKVDRYTGKVDVLWIHNAIETGNVINPRLLDGQVFGGVSMSVGMALSEQIRYRNGISREHSLADYILPTAMDIPKLTNRIVSADEPTGPFGAKGMAELPTVAVAPAITSAVADLYPGILLNSLPIDRVKILQTERRK